MLTILALHYVALQFESVDPAGGSHKVDIIVLAAADPGVLIELFSKK